MATFCTGQIQYCMTRLSRLDGAGVPKPGAGNLYLTDSGVSLGLEFEIEEGVDITQKTGCGNICIAFKDCDRLKRVNLSLEVCSMDPELWELLSGGVVHKQGAQTIGYGAPKVGAACTEGIGVEVWTRNWDGGKPHATRPFIRYIFPRVFFQLSDRTFNEEDASLAAFEGFGNENPNFFNGPANDIPFTADRLFHTFFDTGIPVSQCGALSLAAS